MLSSKEPKAMNIELSMWEEKQHVGDSIKINFNLKTKKMRQDPLLSSTCSGDNPPWATKLEIASADGGY